MDKLQLLLLSLVCIWIGAAFGANLVAAPAKFTVTTLSTADLVSVGRAQFTYVGYVELLLAALGAMGLTVKYLKGAHFSLLPSLFILVAIAVLLAQRFGIHPALIDHPSDLLHKSYVVMEIVKLTALVMAAWLIMRHPQ